MTIIIREFGSGRDITGYPVWSNKTWIFVPILHHELPFDVGDIWHESGVPVAYARGVMYKGKFLPTSGVEVHPGELKAELLAG